MEHGVGKGVGIGKWPRDNADTKNPDEVVGVKNLTLRDPPRHQGTTTRVRRLGDLRWVLDALRNGIRHPNGGNCEATNLDDATETGEVSEHHRHRIAVVAALMIAALVIRPQVRIPMIVRPGRCLDSMIVIYDAPPHFMRKTAQQKQDDPCGKKSGAKQTHGRQR